MESRWLVLATMILAIITIPPSASPTAWPPAQPKQAAPRVDQYGDALPEHALLRLGTVRLRPSGHVTALGFSADDKKLVSINESTGIQVWDVATGKELAAFGGRPYRAAAALSADATQAAVVEGPDVCRIYDVSAGREIREIHAPWADTQVLRFSTDKKLLVSLHGLVVRVWDLATGALVRRWEAADRKAVENEYMTRLQGSSNWPIPAPDVAFSPDGKTVAIDVAYGPITLWDVATGRQFLAFRNGERPHHCRLAFSPNGNHLVAFQDSHLIILDPANILLPQTLKLTGKFAAFCMGFTPDGKSLVVGHDGGDVHAWDLATGRHKSQIAGHRCLVSALAFAPNGKLLATAGYDSTIRTWDMASGKELHSFGGHQAGRVKAWFTPDSKSVLSICERSYSPGDHWPDEWSILRRWDAATGKEKDTASWDGKQTFGYALAADGQVLAYKNWPNGDLRVVNPFTDNKGLALEQPATLQAEALHMTANGSHLAAQAHVPVEADDRRQRFYLWDLAAGKLLLSGSAVHGEFFSCGFTSDGRFLALHSLLERPISSAAEKKPAGPRLHALTYWDVRTGRRSVRAGPPVPFVYIGTFSPSSRLMASRTENGHETATPFNWQRSPSYIDEISEERLRDFGIILGRAVRDPDFLQVGSSEIVIKELACGKSGLVLRAAGQTLSTMAFSPDGRNVAAGTAEGDIVLWDLFTPEPIAKLVGHRRLVSSVAFSADGKRLVSGSDDTSILVWDVSRWTDRTAQPPLPLDNALAAKLWTDLAADDSAKAYAAVSRFLQAPKEAVVFLRQKLHEIQPAHLKEIRELIAMVDSDRFAVRELAVAKLQKLSFFAQPALEKVLAGPPSLEVRQRGELLLAKLENQPLTGELLQAQRALEILEMLGNADAAETLKSLASGDQLSWLTKEAEPAVERLRKR